MVMVIVHLMACFGIIRSEVRTDFKQAAKKIGNGGLQDERFDRIDLLICLDFAIA